MAMALDRALSNISSAILTTVVLGAIGWGSDSVY